MGLFKRKTVAKPPAPVPASTEGLFEEIRRLTQANRARPDRATERQLLRLRHLAGVRLLDAPERAPEYPSPDAARLPRVDGLPEIAPAELTPGLLRAGILRDGCLLVRGLVGREDALELAAEIDRAFAERAAFDAGRAPAAGYYEEFAPETPFEVAVRPWVKQGGGILAADSPKLASSLLDLFEAAASRGWSRAISASRRCCRCRRRHCARPTRRSAARGTRTGLSWATRARSTSGSRSRAAATRRRDSTSSRAASTRSSSSTRRCSTSS